MHQKFFEVGLTRWFVKLFNVLIVLATLLQTSTVVFAEGSRDLYPNGASGSRGNIEWRTSSYGPAGSTIYRRTLLQVFANQGEYILMGSSAVGVSLGSTTGDILVYNPGLVTGSPGTETVPASASFSCNSQRTTSGNSLQGQITSRAEELAGPQAITGGGNSSGYIPCYYQAPSTGIYDVVITGAAGFSSDAQTDPTGEVSLASAANFNSSQDTNVSAWDVTVRSSTTTSTTDMTGRLFTYYLAEITGGNGRPLDSSIYVVTNDGFIYRTDLNGMDPYGFLFYGNSVGFYDSDHATPLYHDVLSTTTAANANQLTQLQGGVFVAPPQFPIFFNYPDPAVLTALGIPTTPSVPQLNTFNFSGTAGGNQSYYNTGGSFSFLSNTSGFFDIIISRGVDFDPTNPLNRVIHAMGHIGTNTISWDGKDNSGNPFPAGTYQVKSTIHAGELHMALIDVENSDQGGPSYTLLNPPATCGLKYGCSTAFYDDRGYTTLSGVTVGTPGSILCGSNPPSISNAVVDGFNSSVIPNQRAFGTSSDGNAGVPCQGSFGDTKGLDLWTYFPSEAVLTIVVVVNSTPPPSSSIRGNALPPAGFAPNVVTNLPAQPADKAYAKTNGLWLEIPSLGVRENIVGVPNGPGGWDITWLGDNIGYLEGTAFPTWAGNSSLAAHVYNSDGTPGPFFNIGKLSWGDQIIVHGWGERYIYEVQTVNNYVNPSDNSLVVKHETYPWVTLITCHGYFEKSNSYLYRTIVRAILIKIEADS
jgi:LPXTG-site transpeptidase (sortase) family protein